MERRSGRTTAAAGERESIKRGMGSVGLWRRCGRGIGELFLWLCMLVPVALFILFMPRLAGMLSMGQVPARSAWSAGAPDRGEAVETSGIVLEAAVR
jgi:hypothetical protein